MLPKAAQNTQPPPGSALKLTKDTAKLFQPKTIKSITLHNRVVVSPMCMYSCHDGFLNDFHLVHLGSFALKGAALIIVEATAVEPQGRISPDDSGLWSDDHIAPLKRVAEFVSSQGGTPGIQLAHAGRKATMGSLWNPGYKIVSDADGGWPDQVRGPSEGVRFDENHPYPHAMSKEDIQEIIDKFVEAAQRALKAGMKVLEIHSAHGYLLHNFLSGNSNKRTDEYGGSLENRLRFPLEVVRAVRKVWPDELPLFVRVSASDYAHNDALGKDPDGWDVYQTIEFAKQLKAIGVDLVDCSSGGNLSGVQYSAGPLYQVPFAERVKKGADIDTGAVGIITEPLDAEHVLQEGKADLVFLARELLRDSAWVLMAAQVLGVDVKWPNQYERSARTLRTCPGKKEEKAAALP